MNRKAILVAAFASMIAASPYASAHLVQIRGGGTCADWMKQRPKQAQLLETWLLGYLSGMAQQLDIHFPKEVSNDAVFLWMDTYCKQNPGKGLQTGGFRLMGKFANNEGVK